jgi:hypothetical protein
MVSLSEMAIRASKNEMEMKIECNKKRKQEETKKNSI